LEKGRRVPRWRPTLPHAPFGGGSEETYPVGKALCSYPTFLQAIGVMALLEEAHGAAIHREMVPFAQDCPALRGETAVWD